MKDTERDIAAVLGENDILRKRVSELERKLARFGSNAADGAEALGASLSEREALLAEAERIAHMGSWVWDVVADRVVWSDELFRILGYDAETERASTEAFFARVHPEDVARVSAASRRGLETGLSEHVEFRLLLPGGRVREASMDAALLFDDRGSLKRAVGTVLDITESREAAAETRRAHRLLEETQRLTSSGSWEWNRDVSDVRWSAQMFRLLGVSESTTPTIDLFRQYVHPDDQESLERLRHRAATTGEIPPTFECRIVRGDGQVRRLQISSGVVHDNRGRIVNVIGSATDVTQTRELEARLHQAQKMEAIGQLSGGIAHDFNNMLMVLFGSIERLRDGDEMELCLKDIETVTRSAATLTQRLLAFSRRAVVMPAVVDLRRVIEEIQPLVTRAIGEEIVTSFEYSHETSVTRVDPNQVHQILLNLAVNARDAMPQGGKLFVDVRSERVAEKTVEDLPAGNYVVVTMKDTGSGIDAATLPRIFEPFFTTKDVGKGTGLGLSMVYGAMKQCGGAITVRSELGDGATFQLYFRLEDVEAEAAHGGPTPVREVTRVLLVEDDAKVRQSIEGMLRRAGCEVFAAGGAVAALTLWKQIGAKVDILATDVVMPEMRGDVLAERLAAEKPGLRVLFITGYAERSLGTERFHGRALVLQKPFHSEDLRRALTELHAFASPKQSES